jgi:hypothetical protein
VLLPEESHAIDHLLRPRARRFEASIKTGILALKVLNALRRDNALASRRLETLETGLCLQRAPTERRKLVT